MKTKTRRKLSLNKETVAALDLRAAAGGATFTCELSYQTCTCRCINTQQCPTAASCPSCDCTYFPDCIE